MEGFWKNFVICFILCTLAFFFLGHIIFGSFWLLMAFFALLLALSITSYFNQETKMEELEKRVAQLEKNDEENQ